MSDFAIVIRGKVSFHTAPSSGRNTASGKSEGASAELVQAWRRKGEGGEVVGVGTGLLFSTPATVSQEGTEARATLHPRSL